MLFLQTIFCNITNYLLIYCNMRQICKTAKRKNCTSPGKLYTFIYKPTTLSCFIWSYKMWLLPKRNCFNNIAKWQYHFPFSRKNAEKFFIWKTRFVAGIWLSFAILIQKAKGHLIFCYPGQIVVRDCEYLLIWCDLILWYELTCYSNVHVS